MNIYIAVLALDGGHKARLSAALTGHHVIYGEGLAADERAAKVAEAEVVFGNPPVEWLAKAPRLKWVQLDSAGVNAHLKLNQIRSGPPVVVTNLSNFFGWPVAEAALAGILAFYRQLPRLLRAQPERRWIKPEVEPEIGRLHGARVVILGAGAIGGKIASLLRPFDGEVRRFARTAPNAELRTLPELDAALSTADLVINALPEVSATIGLLGRERLARLRPTALLVNVGRGSAVDESALLEALDAGRLAGAVLDVTTVEPLPRESPLWTHPKVILTQHTGGRFPGETDAKVTRFLDNFARFVRDEPLPDPVDLNRGY